MPLLCSRCGEDHYTSQCWYAPKANNFIDNTNGGYWNTYTNTPREPTVQECSLNSVLEEFMKSTQASIRRLELQLEEFKRQRVENMFKGSRRLSEIASKIPDGRPGNRRPHSAALSKKEEKEKKEKKNKEEKEKQEKQEENEEKEKKEKKKKEEKEEKEKHEKQEEKEEKEENKEKKKNKIDGFGC
ncbi:PREDICTED: protein PXR1-like [Erythranthe guttata]|uniref:protein PXR1-like n=1 Tax=Erythranthe guttata TaxID=4155 RepID=UPI00064DC314|nr:PREDICTED: protein PXR1-like [Erythranthe guttata]|eukprot:XP_012846416.1 PREDICTED: protein PXR1-like [Erythranthe guttata]